MKSIWRMKNNIPSKESLQGDTKAEVAIIGGGMAGILCAYLLKEKNMNPVIIEANRIAGGVTQNTTAKITTQHSLIYDQLISKFGEEKAKQYATANSLAIDKYEKIIQQNAIECDFMRLPNYMYSLDQTDKLTKEVDAAQALGLDAEFTTETTLPFEVKGAVKFHNQAQFDPLAFIKPLTEQLSIFENTKVQSIEHHRVITDKGIVFAEKIIVASHYPFINVPGYYFARMYQDRSYVLALENAAELDGMYIDADYQGFSFRNFQNLLLFGGGHHKTGQNSEGGRYDSLRHNAKEFYPGSKEVTCWSAQDCMTLDSIPYIGHYAADMPDVYVATGFGKWGMTSSMAAAMILSDMITMRGNENQEVFSPHRFSITASIKNLLSNSGQAVKGLTTQNLSVPKEDISHIPNGHGGTVLFEGEKVGVYKDEGGYEYVVTTKCPHLGCQLEWNPDEKSWDCPCHGSRFDYKGQLLNNPALKGLNDE